MGHVLTSSYIASEVSLAVCLRKEGGVLKFEVGRRAAARQRNQPTSALPALNCEVFNC